jgi:chromosome segregation and condensation protein ScpB
MITPEHEILAFIASNQPIANGALRDHFPQWDIEGILNSLETAGLITKESRPTCQGKMAFYVHHRPVKSATGRE